MLYPKKTKYKKRQKGNICGIENKVNNPKIGFFGIKCLNSGRITAQQIDSVRKLLSRKMQRGGLIRVKIFPYLPVTSKPVETRMGKGKGSLSYWCFPIKRGRLLIEFQGVSKDLAFNINKLVNSKLCLKTKLIQYI